MKRILTIQLNTIDPEEIERLTDARDQAEMAWDNFDPQNPGDEETGERLERELDAAQDALDEAREEGKSDEDIVNRVAELVEQGYTSGTEPYWQIKEEMD